MARRVFGDAIDYDAVEIVHGKWWPFQPARVVMAPDGNIYFHPDSKSYRDDFATASLGLQGLFIHEMTHVWQAQKGGRWFLPLARHPFCRYGYALRPGKGFSSYGLEQQAEIVRRAFLARSQGSASDAPELALLPFGETAADA